MASTLRGTTGPLCAGHDVAMLDLDGVVYVGPDAVPGVPQALETIRAQGTRLAFVTNNAARPPVAVAAHLTELGIHAVADEVITSAQAAARWLADRFGAGAKILVVGTTGLIEALRAQGLEPVRADSEDVVAVVQGYSPDTDWRMLAEGSLAIRRGATWVATNTDPTVPSPRGPLPGNGSLVAALRTATGKVPVVTGKPDPTMHRETVLRTGSRTPLVVGDRLDTDIAGASAVGCPSLLVFSGVTDPADVLAAGTGERPDQLAADLAGLLDVHPEPETVDGAVVCGRWSVTRSGAALVLGRRPDGTPSQATSAGARGFDGDTLDALRALCAARWSATDESASEPVLVVPGDGDGAAEQAITRLGLASPVN